MSCPKRIGTTAFPLTANTRLIAEALRAARLAVKRFIARKRTNKGKR